MAETDRISEYLNRVPGAYQADDGRRYYTGAQVVEAVKECGTPAPQPHVVGSRPAGHCDDDKAWDQFSKDYRDHTRADLCEGDLSDFALANAQFMCDRNSLDLIVYQTAAKERIRWLSIQLARALTSTEVEG